MKHNYLKSLFLMLMMCVGMSAWAEVVTFEFSKQEYSNEQVLTSGSIDSYTSWSATKGGSNDPKYYNTGTALRVYNGGTFSITSTKTIASITLTFSGTGYTFSTSNTTTPQTVYPNATSYSWDVSRTCRLQKVEVTYAGGSNPTTYTVTVANNIENGTVTANPTSAAEGATVTLTATPATGYEFGSWNVTNASTSAAITVSENKFTMPAANVNVSATFNKVQAFEGTITTISAENDADIKFVTGSSSAVGAFWANSTPLTANNITLSGSNGSSSSYSYYDGSVVRFYQNNSFTLTPSNGATIVKVEIVRQSTTGSNSGTINCSGLTASNDNTTTNTNVYTGSATSAVTFTASAQARLTKIIVYSTGGSDSETPEKNTPTLSFSNPSFKATIGEPFTNPTLTNDQEVTVRYTSSDEKIAKVNPVSGEIELVAPGKTTITASFEGNETYNTASASYELIVAPAPFASLDELVAADLANNTYVHVTLNNVPIKSIYVTQQGYRNGVYFDIQKDSKDIEIFFQNVPQDWVAGGTVSGVLSYCPWKNYNGTWELAPTSGWAWTNLTYNAPVILKAPTITTQPIDNTYELNQNASNLTVAATGNPAPTYQWYSNTTNSNENGTLLEGETNPSYTPSTAQAGNFYYYCVATNSEGSATSRVVTITVNGPTPATLPFEFDGGVGDIKLKDGMSQTGIGTDYSASPKLKFDSQGDYIVINFAEAAKNVTYTIKGNGTSGTYAFDVMESADGIEYTTVHSHTSIDNNNAKAYTDNLASNSRFVKFVYTTKASGNVALGKISIVAASELDNPELAFEQSTYTFFTNDEMQVVATSKAGSTGAITYALTSGDADAFLIDENTGDIVCESPGTYTVTATIAEATGFTNSTTTCTVKIKEPVVGNSIIVAKTDDRYYAMTTTCEGSYFQSKEIKKVGDKYVVNSLDDILFYTNTTEGKTTIQSTTNAQYVQATAAKNISFTETEYKWTNAEGVLTAETASYGTLQYNTGSPRFTTYTSKVGQYATIVNLTDVIVGEVATITLNAACHDEDGKVYGTYSNSSAWVVPANLTVSEISIVDGALYVESYKTSDVVPANTGVMVSAEKGGDYSVLIETDPETLELAESVLGEDNCLRPSGDEGINADAMAAATTNCTYYRLTMHNGTQIGFAWGAAEGAAFNLAANKAYLAVPKSASVKSLVWFTGEEDAIQMVENKKFDTKIFNLQGQRVDKAQKGLYIINGRKVVK